MPNLKIRLPKRNTMPMTDDNVPVSSQTESSGPSAILPGSEPVMAFSFKNVSPSPGYRWWIDTAMSFVVIGPSVNDSRDF